ncbi:7145_t:CDS:10 [Dentiscutata heterogama]|uniref:7145_t:CDS:1 n=1 Tax=Dentiscutata heterogama TaxID=1316150 RepID=A0ACA9K7W9_9GLOM|nr:7145_t:CDS:10 [Dentiscutata heterogama]
MANSSFYASLHAHKNNNYEELNTNEMLFFDTFLKTMKDDYEYCGPQLQAALEKLAERYNAAKTKSIPALKSFLYNVNHNSDPLVHVKSGAKIRVQVESVKRRKTKSGVNKSGSKENYNPHVIPACKVRAIDGDELLYASMSIQYPFLKIEILPSRDDPQTLRIGEVEQPIAKDSNPLLVPDVVFHENPKQTEILMQMLQDYQLGEHLLLIGNQGVGKNKLADYFLQLLKLPREYIQLHRDTTVQSLTAIPSIINGVLQFEDSPLGHVLVVDEADKAPTYVTAILRNLLEDGQMVLGDGRRIVSSLTSKTSKEDCIVIHKNFRMIVLANRPGFPFLGNDFYREIGDIFSCHTVDNSDPDSEMFLLRNYAPSVSNDLLLKLTAAFNDLRKLVDEGLISYPYSTRELVNIVKHMQRYPNEGVSYILQNILDFDQYDKVSKDLLIAVFQKHGFPIGLESDYTIRLGKKVPLIGPIITEVWTKSNLERNICEVRKFTMKFRGLWKLHMSEAKELDRAEGKLLNL